MNPHQSRRSFLKLATCAPILNATLKPALSPTLPSPPRPVVCLFSKHLGWIKDYDRLAERTAHWDSKAQTSPFGLAVMCFPKEWKKTCPKRLSL